MVERQDSPKTPYQRAKASHKRQLDEANAAYRKGEIDISQLLQRGQWANYELSGHRPDKPKPGSADKTQTDER